MKKVFYVFFAIGIVLFSCKGDDSGSADLVTVLGRNGNVLVKWINGREVSIPTDDDFYQFTSGYYRGNDLYVSVCRIKDGVYDLYYWKNDTRVSLPSDRTRATTSIYASGDDVFTTGIQNNGELGVFWKNDNPATVLFHTGSSRAYAITGSGSDIYIGGRDNKEAVVWKNGQQSILPSVGNSSAYAIAVSGTDVYVGGTENNDYIPVYWKNGTKNILPLAAGATEARVSSIFVSGTDVYLAGYQMKDGDFYASYWKNGQLTTLTKKSFAYSIFVKGSDVFVAGTTYNDVTRFPAYWKNGEVVSLSASSGRGEAVFINVK
ncbi:hypothetical protein BH10BAC4_BH10BAC4_25870 [soil metagenome]